MDSAQHQCSGFLQQGQGGGHEFAGRRKNNCGVQPHRRSVLPSSHPFRTQLASKLLVACLPRTNNHFHSPMSGHLNGNVSSSSKPVDAESIARLQVCQTQRPKTNNACAQQRRSFNIIKAFRNGIDKAFRRLGIFRITTICRVAGKESIFAKVFLSPTAVLAYSAGAVQPGNADTRSHRVPLRRLSLFDNGSYYLMARNYFWQTGWKFTFYYVEICAANPADTYFYEDFIVCWLRSCHVF